MGNPVSTRVHDLRRRLRLRTPAPWQLTQAEDAAIAARSEALDLEQLVSQPRLESEAILPLLAHPRGRVSLRDGALHTTLGAGATRTLWLRGVVSYPRIRGLLPYHQTSRTLPVLLETSDDARVGLVVACLDRDGNELTRTEQSHDARVPLAPDTMFLRIAITVRGPGDVRLHRLTFGHRAGGPRRIERRSDVLVITNEYPSDDDLYRNAFVHARVRAYRDAGQPVDVLRYARGHAASWHEFDGVRVLTASDESLHTLVQHSGYRHVLVHFVNPGMWDALAPALDHLRVTIWVHGFEVQPWSRRAFNATTDAELAAMREASVEREALWHRLLTTDHPNLRLVFVSDTLRRMVEEDYGVTLDPTRYDVVHNPIDTDRFAFAPKPAEQRLRVLSIRPYASRVYANDLTVAAILAITDAPEFARMTFTLVGDGPLWDETVAPLRSLANVTLRRTFCTQPEIAALHREHGVFLCPSRMDSQGVSRDEAMASGLVPVTTAVAAIPEFVDDSCGILAAPESVDDLAAGLLLLARDPERFSAMSQAAAARVRADRDARSVIARELALIAGDERS